MKRKAPPTWQCTSLSGGYEDGTVDPRITLAWFQHLLWAMLYTGWSYGASEKVSGYEALRLTVYSFLKAVEGR